MGNLHALFAPSSRNTGHTQHRHSLYAHLLDTEQIHLLTSGFSGESATSRPYSPYRQEHTLSPLCGSIEAPITRLTVELKFL